MLVKLQRSLSLAGLRFRVRPEGTEIPDFIEGKPVVAFDKKGEPGKNWVLPRDAIILSEALPVESEKDEPTTLSQIAKSPQATQGFAEAMKAKK